MLKRIPRKRTNASRPQLVKNVRTGETAIYTPDARQPRIPAGWVPLNSGRQRMNSSRDGLVDLWKDLLNLIDPGTNHGWEVDMFKSTLDRELQYGEPQSEAVHTAINEAFSGPILEDDFSQNDPSTVSEAIRIFNDLVGNSPYDTDMFTWHIQDCIDQGYTVGSAIADALAHF